MPLLDLEGRVAVVTGASRGIGLATARRLSEHGAHVVLTARSSAESLRALADELSHGRGRVLALTADVREASEVAGLYQSVFKELRRLDILVNNAGILGDGLIGMIPEATMQDTLATNVLGAMHHLQAATRLMRRGGGGAIVNVSSIVGVRGNAGQTVYASSKAALLGITKSAAKELGPFSIRVNAVCPGYIDTEMIRHLSPEIHRERLASIAMGRIGTPDDVARAVLFLVSDLSTYVTGQVLGVDGGMIL